MTTALVPTPASPRGPAFSERFLQDFISHYYLTQVAETRLEYCEAHQEGLIALPLFYQNAERVEVLIAAVDDRSVIISDNGRLALVLDDLAGLGVRRHAELRRQLALLLTPLGIVADRDRGLWVGVKADTFVEMLPRFIQAIIRVDGLVFRDCLVLERKKGAAK